MTANHSDMFSFASALKASDEKKLAATAQERLAERIAATPKKELQSIREIVKRMIEKREKSK